MLRKTAASLFPPLTLKARRMTNISLPPVSIFLLFLFSFIIVSCGCISYLFFVQFSFFHRLFLIFDLFPSLLCFSSLVPRLEEGPSLR
ncbi:hypothetical protein PMAYCL1PPCAC_01427, partial [Pristionchus mayeri]